MKILHVFDHSLPLHSGYTFRSKNILRAQREAGWDPMAITSPKHEASWPHPTEPVERVSGLRFFRSGRVQKLPPPLYEWRIMSQLYQRICQVVRERRPEILHAHSPVLNAYPALRAGRRFGIPVVYEIRAFWEDAAVDHGSYDENSLQYRAVAAAETRACRKASKVAVLCDGIKRDLVERGIDAGKITTVPNAADLETFGDCPPALDLEDEWGIRGRPVIGFIGSFYDYEGLDLLVDAFARIAARDPRPVLLLVGGGRMEDDLRRQVKKLGVDDRVVFPGRIPHASVPGVYKLLDVAVFPRHSMRLTELVTPLKPMEAMAMQTVCLASDVGGHRELIDHGKTGYLFPSGDVGALTNAIETLLVAGQETDKIKSHARAWVERERTWPAINARYQEVYGELT